MTKLFRQLGVDYVYKVRDDIAIGYISRPYWRWFYSMEYKLGVNTQRGGGGDGV